MTEYQKTYIELKKQFVATNEGPDNVRALYTFKEELEQSEDQQAKEVLVDVYDLLDFKKDAYELLCQIGNRSDKKTLKRLGTLKDYAENWGNHYALPKPKTPEEKQKEKERQAQLGLPFLLFLLFLRRFGLGESIMIAPVFRIVLQRAQPLEGLFIGTISDLAEQFIGILLEVQQIIHIHQHFLGLLILTLLKFFLEGI